MVYCFIINFQDPDYSLTPKFEVVVLVLRLISGGPDNLSTFPFFIMLSFGKAFLETLANGGPYESG